MLSKKPNELELKEYRSTVFGTYRALVNALVNDIEMLYVPFSYKKQVRNHIQNHKKQQPTKVESSDNLTTPIKIKQEHQSPYGLRSTTTSERRRAAVINKQKTQQQRGVAMKRANKNSILVMVGNLVGHKLKKEQVTHSRAVIGVVFSVAESGAGGILVVTEYGIIVHGHRKNPYYVPNDAYNILPSNGSVLVGKLEVIHQSILNDTFDEADHPKISLKDAHNKIYKDIPGGMMKCACRSKKCVLCKCAKAHTACTSSCGCNGSCGNPYNDDNDG